MEERNTNKNAVDPELRRQAEEVLAKLGLPLTTAIEMYYREIILWQGLPFRPSVTPPQFASMPPKPPFEQPQKPANPVAEMAEKFEKAFDRLTKEPEKPKTPAEELRDKLSSNIEQARRFIDATELGKVLNDIKKEFDK